jgi:hypothetical protein
MLKWSVPVEKGNAMIDDGSMGTVVEAVTAKTTLKQHTFSPRMECAPVSFSSISRSLPTSHESLKSSSGERMRQSSFIPVMNADDLRKALTSL